MLHLWQFLCLYFKYVLPSSERETQFSFFYISQWEVNFDIFLLEFQLIVYLNTNKGKMFKYLDAVTRWKMLQVFTLLFRTVSSLLYEEQLVWNFKEVLHIFISESKRVQIQFSMNI